MKSNVLIIILAGLVFFGCSKSSTDGLIVPGNPSMQKINYLALGDSYTVGQSVPNDNFPEQIYDSLTAIGINMNFPEIIAKTGWTTGYLLNSLKINNLNQDTFDFVTLCSGVNNQFRGLDTNIYLAEFDTLVRKAIMFTGNRPDRVWVLSIPDYAYTPFGRQDTTTSKEIDQYNAWNEAIAERYAVNYVNVTDISRLGISNPELVSDDKLHPSALQYTLWIKRFLPQIKELF